ncbi:glycosyltransferase family 4 protein [Roseivirga echinicomitans]
MRVLQIHNRYQKVGGEESVVEEEKNILLNHGHQVFQFIKDSAEIADYSKLELFNLLLRQRASKQVAEALRQVINEFKPDICHVHNVYPLISPVVFSVCNSMGIPVVQTLHNYKMVCTNGLLFREGEVCELCLNKSLYYSIKYKCYRDSYLATAVQADTLEFHRKKGTWSEKVDRYICLTDFQKEKLVSGGMREEIMSVKPNFIKAIDLNVSYEDFFLFVGRLDYSKGLADLLYLFEHNKVSKFVVIGESDDPKVFNTFPNVKFIGKKDRAEVWNYMSRCKAVIFPSKYYEGMPMVILESFALKKAVIARNIGAMSSMISHNNNGLKYDEAKGLEQLVRELDEDDSRLKTLGNNAYSTFREKYNDDVGYQNLIQLYTDVLKQYDNEVR